MIGSGTKKDTEPLVSLDKISTIFVPRILVSAVLHEVAIFGIFVRIRVLEEERRTKNREKGSYKFERKVRIDFRRKSFVISMIDFSLNL